MAKTKTSRRTAASVVPQPAPAPPSDAGRTAAKRTRTPILVKQPKTRKGIVKYRVCRHTKTGEVYNHVGKKCKAKYKTVEWKTYSGLPAHLKGRLKKNLTLPKRAPPDYSSEEMSEVSSTDYDVPKESTKKKPKRKGPVNKEFKKRTIPASFFR